MEDQVATSVVDGMPEESAVVDAQQAQAGEELSAILEETVQEEKPQEQQQTQTEPGWMKQRIGKAVEKAVADAEARMQAKYEAMLAPMREQMLNQEAQELVRSGEFRSIERAKEYIQLKGGTLKQPTQQNIHVQDEQPKIDPAVQAKADMLSRQAEKIMTSRGIDVMAIYNNDSGIQQKIASGEWDFYDVADAAAKKTPPSPVRSANGARSEQTPISRMSDSQWKKLNDNLMHGKKYNLRT